MGRYSLNLRDKYGRDELTGGERINQGIGSAIEFMMQESEARRNERNVISERGGMAVGTPPTAMDRVRGIGGAIRRNMKRTPDITQTGELTGVSNARDGVEPSFVPAQTSGGMVRPATMFADQTAPPPISASLRGSPAYQAQRGTGMMEPPPTSMASIATQPPPAPNGAPQPSSNIAGAIRNSVITGRDGQRYEIDPMRQQNIALQGKRAEARVDDEITAGREGRAQARTQASQEASIKALTDAGMPAAEARARVLTGTVRYDEQFGERKSAAQSLTFEQRQSLQKQRDDAAYARAQAVANGDQAAIRRADLAIRTAELALHTADARADAFDRNASAAQATVPTNPIDRSIANSQGDSTRIAAAESTAQANRDSATRTRTAGAATADSIRRRTLPTPRGPAPAAGAPSKYTADQARTRGTALKTAGKTAQEIYEIMKAEGYNVAPPKAR